MVRTCKLVQEEVEALAVSAKLAEPFGAFIADLARSIPLGRLGTPDDIAAMAALLVSPRGSFVTATTIQVDGGSRGSLL